MSVLGQECVNRSSSSEIAMVTYNTGHTIKLKGQTVYCVLVFSDKLRTLTVTLL